MHLLQAIIAFLGRVCLGAVFLALGAHIFFDWPGSELYLTRALNDWMTITMGHESLQQIVEQGVHASSLLLGVALCCILLGSLLLLLGWWVRVGALLLLLVAVVATPLVYPFWTVNGLEAQMQSALFVKNLGIIGGLLLLVAYGKGNGRKVSVSSDKSSD